MGLILLLIVSVCILMVEIKSRHQLEKQLKTLLSHQEGQPVMQSEKENLKNLTVSSQCCLTLKISSEAETVQMYPRVLGTYKMDKNKRSHYKNNEKNVYLSKPMGRSGTMQGASFTWGVNSDPDKTWGWVRAVRDGECPERITQWAVYDQGTRGWTRDSTLKIHCVPSG